MTEPAIVTNGLTRRFDQVVALDGLDLRVNEGEVHGLIGSNAAGKTTTLRLILGLLQPSAGSVLVLGKNPVNNGTCVRQHIGVVLDPRGLDERYNAWHILNYHGRIWRMPEQERKQRIEALLTTFGLWESKDEPIAGWGRGMKQRLCLARSLLPKPRLVILDEPYAGLDEIVAESITSYLCETAGQSGMTLVMATSNLAVADRCCDHITILHKGRALASGSVSKIRSLGPEPAIEVIGRGFSDDLLMLLLRRPEVVTAHRNDNRVKLTLIANVDTAPLVSLMIESGADVAEVRKLKSSLSEAFCALVHSDKDDRATAMEESLTQ